MYDGGDLCADRIQEEETYATQENNEINLNQDNHNESSIVSSDGVGGDDSFDEWSHSNSEISSDSDETDTDDTTSVSIGYTSSNESSDSDEDEENPPENFYEEGNQVGFVFCFCFLKHPGYLFIISGCTL